MLLLKIISNMKPLSICPLLLIFSSWCMVDDIMIMQFDPSSTWYQLNKHVWSRPWYLLHLISIRFILQLILLFTMDLMMHWLRSNLIVKVLPWWDLVTNFPVSQYKYCLLFSANYLIRRINVRNLNHTKSVIGPKIGLLR